MGCRLSDLGNIFAAAQPGYPGVSRDSGNVILIRSAAAAPNPAKRVVDAPSALEGPQGGDVRRRTASPASSGGAIVYNNHSIHQGAAAAKEQALVAAR
ncbi:hypothetical protein OC835_007137 [Tilletia horrida]|nr:hypothetical protein OC835_007137 [Tilletia horrida]